MEISKPAASYDIVVVGGGMVGASFACALSKACKQASNSSPLSILVVEAVQRSAQKNQQLSFDARSTALSFGSRKIYEQLGLWAELESVVTPIKEIQVSDKGRFGSTQLSHAEHGQEALGYVVENSQLGTVLNSALDTDAQIEVLAPALIAKVKPQPEGMQLEISLDGATHNIEASLVVLADGGRSPICQQLGIERVEQHYQQHAVIANIAFEKPHNNMAFERFTDSGPLAVLPLASYEGKHRGSLVWTVDEQDSDALVQKSESDLLSLLMERFGSRLGQITHIGERFCYPLSLTVAREQIRPGLVLLGNVAHTLHPVAGQGLNLALRDTAALVQVLGEAITEKSNPGTMKVLQRYLDAQDFDQQKSIGLTDGMTRLFSSNSGTRVWARKAGLLAIDLLPGVRRGFARQAMGIGGS